MTSEQRHIIGKQHLDVTFNGSESGAIALQSAISGLSRLGVTAAIERILDRYANSASVLRIDQLVVDAGAVPLDQLEARLPAMIAEALEKSLAKIATPDVKVTSEAIEEPIGRQLSEAEAAVDALLFCLRHATLPATFRPQSHESFEAQLLEAWKSPAMARQTAEALASPTARQRLLKQFSRQVTAMLIEELSPDAMPVIEKILDQFRRSGLPDELVRRIERKLLDETLALSATQTSIAPAELRETLLSATMNLPKLPERIRAGLPGYETEAGSRARTKQRPSAPDSAKDEATRQTRDSAPPAKQDSEQTPPSTADKAAQEPEEIRSDRSDRSDGSLATPLDGSPGSRDKGALDLEAEDLSREQTDEPPAREVSAKQPESGSPTSPAPDSSSTPAAAKTRVPSQPAPNALEAVHEHPDERRGLYVENAGLVLLHPFLPQFFRASQIAGESELLRPDAALRILHYLATGDESAPEYDLALPKIICGLHPTSLAEEAAPLSGDEREEAVALLSAVIRHWDALKNTGIDALRENFLKRNGKLTRWHDGGWLLQVESNSFDILLDRLPWGFSMIRLPWMPSMLHVEWRF